MLSVRPRKLSRETKLKGSVAVKLMSVMRRLWVNWFHKPNSSSVMSLHFFTSILPKFVSNLGRIWSQPPIFLQR